MVYRHAAAECLLENEVDHVLLTRTQYGSKCRCVGIVAGAPCDYPHIVRRVRDPLQAHPAGKRLLPHQGGSTG